jgi:hypothetical protein
LHLDQTTAENTEDTQIAAALVAARPRSKQFSNSDYQQEHDNAYEYGQKFRSLRGSNPTCHAKLSTEGCGTGFQKSESEVFFRVVQRDKRARLVNHANSVALARHDQCESDAPSYDGVPEASRTIADFDGKIDISPKRVSQAIQIPPSTELPA